MGRQEKRLYTVGRFWLAAREQSPFLQIRWYDERTKTTRSKSSGCRTLDDAIPVILAHHANDLADGQQEPSDALVATTIRQYWNEHGRTRINAAATAHSLRTFLAFLDRDAVTIAATIADMKPEVFRRFMRWRMKPHSYEIEWIGETYAHASEGVSGEAVQRALDDVRAAFNHAVAEGRLPYAPKVPAVPTEHRSPPRDVRLTIEQLGAIVGYAAYDIEALRWILGMIATACRPDAVLKWNVAAQWKGRGPVFDTHPAGAPRTKKRNAVVPVIDEFRPWLEAWADCPHKRVGSRKTWWRTMRAALDLPDEIVPKTIRHTIATELRRRGVSLTDIAGLLGHTSESRITQVYAKYDPARLPHVKQALSAIWGEVCAEANKWLTNHFRVTPAYGTPISVARKQENV
jgi:integrase